MLKRVALIFLMVLALLVIPVSRVLADTEDITVTFNDVQVYINGILTSFKDEYGKPIEPFIYNGKIYLPLNSISDALGMSYTWDGSSMSAYMGVSQGEEQYLIDVRPAYDQSDYVDLYSSSEGSSFDMAGVSYTNGYIFGTNNRYALFNLNGEYESVSFMLGHIDGADMHDAILKVFLDGELEYEYEIPAQGLPQRITIPLNRALSMKLNTVNDSYGTDIGLGEITIK